MHRKKFIKDTCTLCIGSLLIGLPFDTHAKKNKPLKLPIENNAIALDIATFSENNSNILIIRNSNLDADILIVKKEEEYTALQMLCTHEGIPLSYRNEKLICSAHGSQFDMQGQVLIEPAQKPLKKYATSISENKLQLIIKITDI